MKPDSPSTGRTRVFLPISAMEIGILFFKGIPGAPDRKQALSCLLVASMLFSIVAPPLAEASIWEERKKSRGDIEAKRKNAERPWEWAAPVEFYPQDHSFQVPENMGKLVDTFTPQAAQTPLESPADSRVNVKPPFVIHIQDAHGYPTAQKNLARMIKHFRDPGQKSGLLVCVEGAWKKVDLEWLHVFPDQEITKTLSENLLEKGEITGEEWVGIREGGGFVDIQGIEEEEIYWDNVDAKEEIERVRRKILEGRGVRKVHVKSILKGLDRLVESSFPRELLELRRKKERLVESKISLGGYALYLKSILPPSAWDRSASASMQSFADASAMEAELDWEKIAQERNQAMKTLGEKLDRSALAHLADMSLKFRMGQIKPREFYSRFHQLAQVNGLAVHRIGNFIEYLKKSEAVDETRVKEDLDRIEASAEEVLTAGHPAIVRKILAAEQWASLAKKLWALEMSPEEWKKYQELSGAMNWPEVRRILALAKGLPPAASSDWSDFESLAAKNQQTAQRYYDLAHRRDRILAEKSLLIARQKGAEKLILVAGGFHTAGITRALREQNVPYVIVRPNMGDMQFVKRDDHLNRMILEAGTLRDLSFTNAPTAAPHMVSTWVAALRAKTNAAKFEQDLKAFRSNLERLAADGSEHAQSALSVLDHKLRLATAVLQSNGRRLVAGTLALKGASVPFVFIFDRAGDLVRRVTGGAEINRVLTESEFEISDEPSGAQIADESGALLDPKGRAISGLRVQAVLAAGKVIFRAAQSPLKNVRHLLDVREPIIAAKAADHTIQRPPAQGSASIQAVGASIDWLRRAFYSRLTPRQYTLEKAWWFENRLFMALSAGIVGLPVYYLTGNLNFTAELAYLAAWPLFYVAHWLNPQYQGRGPAAAVSALNMIWASSLFYGIPIFAPSFLSFAAIPFAIIVSGYSSEKIHLFINRLTDRSLRRSSIHETGGAFHSIRNRIAAAVVAIIFAVSSIAAVQNPAAEVFSVPSLTPEQIAAIHVGVQDENAAVQPPVVSEKIPETKLSPAWWSREKELHRITNDAANRQTVREAAQFYNLPSRLGFVVLAEELFNKTLIERFTDPLFVRTLGQASVGIAQINTERARDLLVNDPYLLKQINQLVGEKDWSKASAQDLEDLLNQDKAGIWIMTSYLHSISVSMRTDFTDPYSVGLIFVEYQGVASVDRERAAAVKEVFDQAYREYAKTLDEQGFKTGIKIIENAAHLSGGEKLHALRAFNGAADYFDSAIDETFNDAPISPGAQSGKAEQSPRMPPSPTVTPSPAPAPTATATPAPAPQSQESPSDIVTALRRMVVENAAEQAANANRFSASITGYNPYLYIYPGGLINTHEDNVERMEEGKKPFTGWIRNGKQVEFEPVVEITLDPNGNHENDRYKYNPGGHIAVNPKKFPYGTKIMLKLPKLEADGRLLIGPDKKPVGYVWVPTVAGDTGGAFINNNNKVPPFDIGFVYRNDEGTIIRYRDSRIDSEIFPLPLKVTEAYVVQPGGTMLWVRDWLLPKFGVRLSAETYRRWASPIENTMAYLFSGLTVGSAGYALGGGNLEAASWAAYIAAWPIFIFGHSQRVAGIFGSRAPRENLKIAAIVGTVNLLLAGLYFGANSAFNLPTFFHATPLIGFSILAAASYAVHQAANAVTGRSPGRDPSRFPTVFNSVKQIKQNAPARIQRILGEHGLNAGAAGGLMDLAGQIYEESLGGAILYHHHPHNLAAAYAALELAVAHGQTSERDMKVTFLAALLHDFHVRGAEPPSPASVPETLLQLRDMLELGKSRGPPRETAYRRVVTEEIKTNFRNSVRAFVGDIDLDLIWREVEAIIRRTDFPSDIAEPAPSVSRSPSGERTPASELRQDIEQWAGGSRAAMRSDQIRAKIYSVLKRVEEDRVALRAVQLELSYFEALAKIPTARRTNVHRLAVMTEKGADQSGFYWLMTPKTIEREVIPGLKEEIGKDRAGIEWSYPSYFAPTLLASEAADLIAKLPLSFRENFFAAMEHFAKLSTEAGAKMPESGLTPLEDWNNRKGRMNKQFFGILLNASESENELAGKLREPLNSRDKKVMAGRFLEGGFGQDGYGVPEGAAVDGSFASEGSQGYFVERSGREAFLKGAVSMREFFERRERIAGEPIRVVIKPGIGGQHTPFQAISDIFSNSRDGITVNGDTVVVLGEYELGKDYEKAVQKVLDRLGAGWDQVAIIPSSKSGSTDETMMIFVDLFAAALKNVASKKVPGLNGARFADIALDTLRGLNFTDDGRERPDNEFFDTHGGRLTEMVRVRARTAGLSVTRAQVIDIFATVLGNMYFETTDQPEQGRLSAFFHNSGIKNHLGAYAPGLGAMFDNVGGRWTADLHMMTFLGLMPGLDAQRYWDRRNGAVVQTRAGGHRGSEIGNRIVDARTERIALLVPDELFWFGKSVEQNFNESIWQDGSPVPTLVTVKASQWSAQKDHYEHNPDAFIINLADLDIAQGAVGVVKVDVPKLAGATTQEASDMFADLQGIFYALTNTVGNRLIVRALEEAGYGVEDADLNDLDNPATRIVQQNLFLRQPYIELGKGLLEEKLTALQGRKNPVAELRDEYDRILREARGQRRRANFRLRRAARQGDEPYIAKTISEAMDFAKENNRMFVPVLYLEGQGFVDLRESLTGLGIEWVLQGTGDQHINFQHVLAHPEKFLPFIISFVPDNPLPGKPAVGFAKGYLHNVSPHLVSDAFAEATYQALTEKRKDQGGRGVFMRIEDTEQKRDMVLRAFKTAVRQHRMKSGAPEPVAPFLSGWMKFIMGHYDHRSVGMALAGLLLYTATYFIHGGVPLDDSLGLLLIALRTRHTDSEPNDDPGVVSSRVADRVAGWGGSVEAQIAAQIYSLSERRQQSELKELGLRARRVPYKIAYSEITDIAQRINLVRNKPYDLPKSGYKDAVINEMNWILQAAGTPQGLLAIFAERLEALETARERGEPIGARSEIQRQIREVIAPLADRVGREDIAQELWNASVRELIGQDAYQELLSSRTGAGDPEEIVYNVSEWLKDAKIHKRPIPFERVNVRVKTPSSLVTKAIKRGFVNDLIGITVVFPGPASMGRAMAQGVQFSIDPYNKIKDWTVETRIIGDRGDKRDSFRLTHVESVSQGIEFTLMTRKDFQKSRSGSKAHWSYKLREDFNTYLTFDEEQDLNVPYVVLGDDYDENFWKVFESAQNRQIVFGYDPKTGAVIPIEMPKGMSQAQAKARFPSLRFHAIRTDKIHLNQAPKSGLINLIADRKKFKEQKGPSVIIDETRAPGSADARVIRLQIDFPYDAPGLIHSVVREVFPVGDILAYHEDHLGGGLKMDIPIYIAPWSSTYRRDIDQMIDRIQAIMTSMETQVRVFEAMEITTKLRVVAVDRRGLIMDLTGAILAVNDSINVDNLSIVRSGEDTGIGPIVERYRNRAGIPQIPGPDKFAILEMDLSLPAGVSLDEVKTAITRDVGVLGIENGEVIEIPQSGQAVPDVQEIIRGDRFRRLKTPDGAAFPKFLEDNIKFKKIGRFSVLSAKWRADWERRGRDVSESPFTSVTQKRAPMDPSFTQLPEEQTFWRHEIEGRNVSFVQQSYPFLPDQFMVVPEMQKNHPQILQKEDIKLALSLLQANSSWRFRMGFNSLAGAASVNQLHLHGFNLDSDEPSALEQAETEPLDLKDYPDFQGVSVEKVANYPARGLFFRSDDLDRLASVSFSYVKHLQDTDVTHIVIFVPGGVYVMPQQKNYVTSFDNAWAFSEFMGMIVMEKDIPPELDESALEEEMSLVTLGEEEFDAGYQKWLPDLEVEPALEDDRGESKPFNLGETAAAMMGWGIAGALGFGSAFFGLGPDFATAAEPVFRAAAAVVGSAGLFGALLYSTHGLLGVAAWSLSRFFAEPSKGIFVDGILRQKNMDTWALRQFQERLPSSRRGVYVPRSLPIGTLARTDYERQTVDIQPWLVMRWGRFDFLRKILLPIVLAHEGERLRGRSTLRIYLEKPFKTAFRLISDAASKIFPQNEVPIDQTTPDVLAIIDEKFPRLKGPDGSPLPEFFAKKIKYEKRGRFFVLPAPWRGDKPLPSAPYKKVRQDFDPKEFNFNRFPPEKVFFDGIFSGQQVSFVQQDSPYADNHFMVVPQMRENRPQFLEKSDIELGLNLVLGDPSRRMRLGFNSLGSGASVNHMHLHALFIEPRVKMPLEEAGTEPLIDDIDGVSVEKVVNYPARGLYFRSPDTNKLAEVAHTYVRHLQDKKIAHVVIFASGGIFVMPVQTYVVTSFGNTWSLAEIMGYVVLEKEQNVPPELDESALEEEMSLVTLGEEEFNRTVRHWMGAWPQPLVATGLSGLLRGPRDRERQPQIARPISGEWLRGVRDFAALIKERGLLANSVFDWIEDADADVRVLEARGLAAAAASRTDPDGTLRVFIAQEAAGAMDAALEVVSAERRERIRSAYLAMQIIHELVEQKVLADLNAVPGEGGAASEAEILAEHMGFLAEVVAAQAVSDDDWPRFGDFLVELERLEPSRDFLPHFTALTRARLQPVYELADAGGSHFTPNSAIMEIFIEEILDKFPEEFPESARGWLTADSVRGLLFLMLGSAARDALLRPAFDAVTAILSPRAAEPARMDVRVGHYLNEPGEELPANPNLDALLLKIQRVATAILRQRSLDENIESELNRIQALMSQEDFYIVVNYDNVRPYSQTNATLKRNLASRNAGAYYLEFVLGTEDYWGLTNNTAVFTNERLIDLLLQAFETYLFMAVSGELRFQLIGEVVRSNPDDYFEEQSHEARANRSAMGDAEFQRYIENEIRTLRATIRFFGLDGFIKEIEWRGNRFQYRLDWEPPARRYNPPGAPGPSAQSLSGVSQGDGTGNLEMNGPMNHRWLLNMKNYLYHVLFDRPEEASQKTLDGRLPAFWDLMEEMIKWRRIILASGLNSAAMSRPWPTNAADRPPYQILLSDRIFMDSMDPSNIEQALEVVEPKRRLEVRDIYLGMQVFHEMTHIALMPDESKDGLEPPAATVNEEFAAFMAEVLVSEIVDHETWPHFNLFINELESLASPYGMNFSVHLNALNEAKVRGITVDSFWADPEPALALFKEEVLDRFPEMYPPEALDEYLYAPETARRRMYYLLGPGLEQRLAQIYEEAADQPSPANIKPVEILPGSYSPFKSKKAETFTYYNDLKNVVQDFMKLLSTAAPIDLAVRQDLERARAIVFSAGFHIQLNIDAGAGDRHEEKARLNYDKDLEIWRLDLTLNLANLKAFENREPGSLDNLKYSIVDSFVRSLEGDAGLVDPNALVAYLAQYHYRSNWAELFDAMNRQFERVINTTDMSSGLKKIYIEDMVKFLINSVRKSHMDAYIKNIRWDPFEERFVYDTVLDAEVKDGFRDDLPPQAASSISGRISKFPRLASAFGSKDARVAQKIEIRAGNWVGEDKITRFDGSAARSSDKPLGKIRQLGPVSDNIQDIMAQLQTAEPPGAAARKDIERIRSTILSDGFHVRVDMNRPAGRKDSEKSSVAKSKAILITDMGLQGRPSAFRIDLVLGWEDLTKYTAEAERGKTDFTLSKIHLFDLFADALKMTPELRRYFGLGGESSSGRGEPRSGPGSGFGGFLRGAKGRAWDALRRLSSLRSFRSFAAKAAGPLSRWVISRADALRPPLENLPRLGAWQGLTKSEQDSALGILRDDIALVMRRDRRGPRIDPDKISVGVPDAAAERAALAMSPLGAPTAFYGVQVCQVNGWMNVTVGRGIMMGLLSNDDAWRARSQLAVLSELDAFRHFRANVGGASLRLALGVWFGAATAFGSAAALNIARAIQSRALAAFPSLRDRFGSGPFARNARSSGRRASSGEVGFAGFAGLFDWLFEEHGQEPKIVAVLTVTDLLALRVSMGSSLKSYFENISADGKKTIAIVTDETRMPAGDVSKILRQIGIDESESKSAVRVLPQDFDDGHFDLAQLKTDNASLFEGAAVWLFNGFDLWENVGEDVLQVVFGFDPLDDAAIAVVEKLTAAAFSPEDKAALKQAFDAVKLDASEQAVRDIKVLLVQQ